MEQVARDPIDAPRTASGPDPLTLTAFAATAILAGANAVAIRIGNAELAPFWGAALRFLSAAALLLLAAIVLRLPFPRGRALVGATLYGLLAFGLSYAFAYFALQTLTAGTTMVILAIVPLLTLILAALQRVERFSARGLIGAVIGAAGIALVFAEKIGGVTLLPLLAALGGAFCIAETPIVVKRFPPVHPVVANGIGMAIGGVLLLALSLATGEAMILPNTPQVQLSLVYLVLLGSIGLFLLFLFVLSRWTASASSYEMVIAPLVAIALGYFLLDEPATPFLLAGAALVAVGVYVGAIRQGNPAGRNQP